MMRSMQYSTCSKPQNVILIVITVITIVIKITILGLVVIIPIRIIIGIIVIVINPSNLQARLSDSTNPTVDFPGSM